MRVRGDDLESIEDLLLCCGAADIEEVCGLAAGKIDGIHGGHGKPGAVDEACDLAVETNVVEIPLGRSNVARVLLGLVAEGKDGLLARGCVVVKVELAVKAEDLVLALDGGHGVDLDQCGVALLKEGIELADELGGLAVELLGDAHLACHLLELFGLEAAVRVKRDLDDLLRGLFGNTFNVHTAFRRANNHWAAKRPVHRNPKVELLVRLHNLAHKNGVDGFSLGACLFCDQFASEHLFRDFPCLFRTIHQMHTSLESIRENTEASTSRKNLCFHRNFPAKFLRLLNRFLFVMSRETGRAFDSFLIDQTMRNIFMNIQISH
eukprot:comp18991_c0_seq1/m.34978 comp18991_c0_seq1/g.34978  ORF comp18991_c0_seq1/g.34978 comp18991_c0_seq1/m.34978 type:complete len:321 (-) comp18991_c0_seq1:72-1034(-)